jgi:hypothetical protein
MVSPDPRFDAQGQPMAARLKDVKWQPMGQEDVIMCGKFASLDASAGNANGLLDGIEDFSQPPAGSGVDHAGASGASHR